MSSTFQVFYSLYQPFWDCPQVYQLQLVSPYLHVPHFYFVRKQGLSNYLSFHFLLILFCVLSRRKGPLLSRFSFPFILFYLSGRVAEIRGFVCIPKSQRTLCVSLSQTDSQLCICHLFAWSNFNFLHKSQMITFLTQLCIILYSFCEKLLHSHIIRLIVSSLLPHNPQLLFCCVWSIFV